jgi:iron complex outermembrane receptor protein
VRGAAEADRSDGHRAGTDYRVTQLRGSLERATPLGRVVLDAGQGLRRFGAADFYSPFFSDETTRSTTAAVRLVPTPESRVSLSGALHTRRHSDLFTLKRNDPAFYQNQHLSWQTGGEATVRAALSPLVVAAVGGEVLDARLRSARLGNHDELRRGVFGEMTVGRARGATLAAGARGDWSRAGGFFSPSLGIALPVNGVLQLRASGSRGFRAPTWTERYYVDPANVSDSTLSVERVWSDEIGARITPGSRLIADVSLFERHATSLIDWARPAGAAASTPWHTMNFARATYRGVEALVRLSDVAGIDWTARGSGLRFDATTAPGTVGKYALRPLTRSLGLSGTRQIGADASITLSALNARRVAEKSYTKLDAQLAQRFGGLRYSIDLLNLTNASYLDGSGKPVASRSAFIEVGWPAR